MSVLHQADRSGHQRREHADNRDDLHDHRRVREQHGVAADHVDAGRHHRRGVDQRRHRRRTLHGVRQPDVEGNLRALAGGPDEQQQADRRQHAELRRLDRQHGGGVLHGSKIERAEGDEDQEDTEHEAPIADPVGDERLFPGVSGALLFVPIADQQVGTEPHPFPPYEHHQEIAAQDEREHEEAEEIQVAEEAGVAAPWFVGHIGR